MAARPLPDRLAVESDLSGAQLEGLRETCEAIGIRVERWPMVPALRTATVLSAAARRVRLFEAEGASQSRAIRATAVRYGIGDKALEKNLTRARKAAWATEEGPENHRQNVGDPPRKAG